MAGEDTRKESARPGPEVPVSDRSLIDRCKRGDLGAFDQLFRRYTRQVYNYAFRMIPNYDDANDIAQEAFLRAYNSIKSFRGESNFSTWLFRIVYNVSLDEIKRRKNRSYLSLDEQLESDEEGLTRQVESQLPTPQEIIEKRERDRIIQEAIAVLPDYQKAMIVLYHMEGFSYEEIAEIVGLPIGTVKSRLNRARESLKEKLKSQRELFGF
ncbi:MAG: sigma-70 family RNA polymerase sigma factor [Armatimonadetes bacterium]|nr:sigma-70 family RNA polymerase sigma factor [Armatimonadota bacterium]